jgi:hypothetical protein
MVSIFLKDNTATYSGITQVPHSELEYEFIVVLQDARNIPQ